MHKFYDVVTKKETAPKAVAISLESFNADQYLLEQEFAPMAQVVAIAEATYPALEAISEQAQNLAARINDGETISKAEVASVKAFAAHVFHDELNMPKEQSSIALEAIDDLAGDDASIALEAIGETLANGWAAFKKWLASMVSKFTGLFKKGGFLRKWFDKMISGISSAYQGVKSTLIGTKIKVSLNAKSYKDLKGRTKAVNKMNKTAKNVLTVYSKAVDKCLKSKSSDWKSILEAADKKVDGKLAGDGYTDFITINTSETDGIKWSIVKGTKNEVEYKVRPWSDFKANLDALATPSATLDTAERLTSKLEGLSSKAEGDNAAAISSVKDMVSLVNNVAKTIKEGSSICFQDLTTISVAVRGRKGDKKDAKAAAKEAKKAKKAAE